MKLLLFLTGATLSALVALAAQPASWSREMRLSGALTLGLIIPLIAWIWTRVSWRHRPSLGRAGPSLIALLLQGLVVACVMGPLGHTPGQVVDALADLTTVQSTAAAPGGSSSSQLPAVPSAPPSALPPAPPWSVAIGGVAHDVVNTVAVGAKGQVFAAGTEGGKDVELTANVQTGGGTFFVTAFEPDGKPLWKTSFPIEGEIYARHLRPLEDGSVLVVVSIEGELSLGGEKIGEILQGWRRVSTLLMRFDPEGRLLFSHQLQAIAAGVTSTPGGDIYLAANFWQTTDIGGQQAIKNPPLQPFFLARLAPDGTARWLQVFESQRQISVRALAVHGEHLWMSGNASTPFDLGGGRIEPQGHATWLARFDLSGRHQLSRIWLDGDLTGGARLAGDGDGVTAEVLLPVHVRTTVRRAGQVVPRRGNFEVLITRFRLDGSEVWSRSIGTPNPELANADVVRPLPFMALLEGGELFVAGSFEVQLYLGPATLTPTARGGDLVFAKLNLRDGTFSAAHVIGVPGTEEIRAMELVGTELILGGWFTKSLDLAGPALEAPQKAEGDERRNGFVARLPLLRALAPD